MEKLLILTLVIFLLPGCATTSPKNKTNSKSVSLPQQAKKTTLSSSKSKITLKKKQTNETKIKAVSGTFSGDNNVSDDF